MKTILLNPVYVLENGIEYHGRHSLLYGMASTNFRISIILLFVFVIVFLLLLITKANKSKSESEGSSIIIKNLRLFMILCEIGLGICIAILVTLGLVQNIIADVKEEEYQTTERNRLKNGFYNMFFLYFGDDKTRSDVERLIDQANGTNRTSIEHRVSLVDFNLGIIGKNDKGDYILKVEEDKKYKVYETAFDEEGFLTEIAITYAD